MRADARARLDRALARLAGGEREAFDEVFSLAWPVLRSLALSLLKDPAEAEDVAQRALMKLFSSASRFEPGRSALPWIVTFGINEVRTSRSRSRRRTHEEVCPRMPSPSDLETELLEADLQAALHQILGTLTDDDRIALGLASAEDASTAPATRRKRKQRALSRLRQAWRRIHGTAGA